MNRHLKDFIFKIKVYKNFLNYLLVICYLAVNQLIVQRYRLVSLLFLPITICLIYANKSYSAADREVSKISILDSIQM